MAVERDPKPEDEMAAKRKLEFYGFWLWNYENAITDRYKVGHGAHGRFQHDAKVAVKKLECISCTMNDCASCHIMSYNNKQKFIAKIYDTSFTEYSSITTCLNRLSSKDILLNAYDIAIDNNKNINLSRCYKLQPRMLSIKVLNNTATKENFNQRKQNFTLNIDTSWPIDIIHDDIYYIKKIAGNNAPNQEPNDKTLQDNNFNKVPYARILKILNKTFNISFTNDLASRALGFWLWEQVDILENFRKTGDAVKYLTTAKEFPANILSCFRCYASSSRHFTRLRKFTENCVREREVLPFK